MQEPLCGQSPSEHGVSFCSVCLGSDDKVENNFMSFQNYFCCMAVQLLISDLHFCPFISSLMMDRLITGKRQYL